MADLTTDALFKRIFMFLEDGDWRQANEYCERVLDIDPENARVYVGKLCAELQIKYEADLANHNEPLDNMLNYKKILRFADANYHNKVIGYNKAIKERIRLEQESNRGTFTDPRDGNVYKTIKIGSQVWMAENLNYDIKGFFGSKSKCYNNDPKIAEEYGRLYDWKTAKEAAPPGWHLPTYTEWQTLVDFVGGDKVAGEKLKSKSGWSDNGNGTDEFEFSALPCGNRNYIWQFQSSGSSAGFWSATEDTASNAWSRGLLYFSTDMYRNDLDKSYMFSVRCVRDHVE